MAIITGKHLHRRTVLRGLGASVALPFLDAMIPAGRRGTAAAEAATERTPLVCIEEVHGVPGCNEWGASQNLFAPATTGADFEITDRNVLASLRPFQKDLTIISNTDVRMAEAHSPPEIGGDHFRSSAVFLTQSHPKQTQGSDIFAGTSMDQMYAKEYGQDTPMPSMQFCIENLDQAGGCTYNYSCVYTDSISWASPTEPLPMVRDPRVAFDMLFGAGRSPEDRAERRATRRSILDWIANDVKEVRAQLGAMDRPRLDQYLENVREIERRIQMVEAQNMSGERSRKTAEADIDEQVVVANTLPEAPAGVPDSFREHMEMLFDLQVLALESDMTRVISFKLGRDSQNRTFPESGTDKPFHPASHHGNKEENILDFNKICQYRMSMLPYFLEKMSASVEDGRSLLDKSMVLWGSPMADGNIHNHRRCPMILLGHAGGQLAGNMHLKADDGTPMANVMLSMLDMLGVQRESFGDSTGRFDLTASA